MITKKEIFYNKIEELIYKYPILNKIFTIDFMYNFEKNYIDGKEFIYNPIYTLLDLLIYGWSWNWSKEKKTIEQRLSKIKGKGYTYTIKSIKKI